MGYDLLARTPVGGPARTYIAEISEDERLSV